jgi:hypothetical protein
MKRILLGGTYLVTTTDVLQPKLVLTVTLNQLKVSTPVTICSGETYLGCRMVNYTENLLVTNDGCTANQIGINSNA